jgi:hypothetical protein
MPLKNEIIHERVHLESKVYVFAIQNNLVINVDKLWKEGDLLDNFLYCLNVYILAKQYTHK